jgi:hypothetical protein
MNKKRKSLKKAAEIKKSLKDFLADEDGYVKKETVLKIGLATVAGIGMLGALTGAFASTAHSNHSSHNNTVIYPDNSGPASECPAYIPDHTNIPNHHNVSHHSY